MAWTRTHLDYHFQPVEVERQAVVHAVFVRRHEVHCPVAGVGINAALEVADQKGGDTAAAPAAAATAPAEPLAQDRGGENKTNDEQDP